MPHVEIIASIERKYKDELSLYGALHALCQQQEHAMREGLAEEVLRLKRAKQELMRQINALESEIQVLRSSLVQIQAVAPSIERGRVVHENDKRVVALRTESQSEVISKRSASSS